MRKPRSSNHGLCKSPEYRAWAQMIQRCTNKKLPKYARYGGRWISVCERWRFDFTLFLADVGPRPSRAHSLDRIDVNGHYEPGNVRWATSIVQQNNKTTNRHMEVDGELLTLAEVARRRGVPPCRVSRELWRLEAAARTEAASGYLRACPQPAHPN